MTDPLTDLLDEAADDTGAPLGFTTADVVARGRARRRRRRAVEAGLLAVLVAAGAATTLAVLPDGDDRGDGAPVATDPPSPAPTTAPTTAPSETVSAEPAELTGREALVYGRCRSAADPWLADWRLDAQVSDRTGSTATFVSPQGDRWRTCTLGPSASADAVSDPWPLDTSEVPPEEIAYDGSVEYASLCAKDGPPSCTERLYYAALPLRENVASIEVQTPAGKTVTPALGERTYVVRFVESGSNDALPSIDVTLRDDAGKVIVLYDYNDLMR